MNFLSVICRIPFISKMISKQSTSRSFLPEKKCMGLTFPNPVGLAAGFDKNARYLKELELLGFGFVEIGTVTPLPQDGNSRPRLFRLPQDQAIINRMGFNNDGVKVVAERVRLFRELSRQKKTRIIIGGNIGKNKVTPNEDAWKDYAICFTELHDTVDYFVVNVSSPNTPGLRDLQQKDSLRKILTALQEINHTKSIRRPLLLKISPDLSPQDLDDIIDLSMEIKLDGLVAANTTIKRTGLSTPEGKVQQAGAGGLSGKPLREEALRITQYIHEKTHGSLPVISSGGIFTAADAKKRFENGASLVQVWTGFIYEGPLIVRKIMDHWHMKQLPETPEA